MKARVMVHILEAAQSYIRDQLWRAHRAETPMVREMAMQYLRNMQDQTGLSPGVVAEQAKDLQGQIVRDLEEPGGLLSKGYCSLHLNLMRDIPQPTFDD